MKIVVTALAHDGSWARVEWVEDGRVVRCEEGGEGLLESLGKEFVDAEYKSSHEACMQYVKRQQKTLVPVTISEFAMKYLPAAIRDGTFSLDDRNRRVA